MKRNRAASAQSLAADQHPILVGIKIFARIEGHAAESDGDIAVADALLDAFLRMGVQCADADVDAVDIAGIADAAIDDDAFPAVFPGQDGQLVADQRAAARAASVNHQHAAFARRLQRGPHQPCGVVGDVLVQLLRRAPVQGGDLAVLEHGRLDDIRGCDGSEEEEAGVIPALPGREPGHDEQVLDGDLDAELLEHLAGRSGRR